MKYVPHDWDRYGTPVLDSPEEEDEDLGALEKEAEYLRDFVAQKESEIEDLEMEIREAEEELYQISKRLRPMYSATPSKEMF